MAKMTISDLQSFVASYVDASKQAGTWVASHANLYGVLDKIGKMVTIDGNFSDKLAILDGDELPLGKTIEEYFLDLTLPIDWTNPADVTTEEDETPQPVDFATGALRPYLPEVEDVCYSYSLGRKVIPTSVPYDNVERGATDTAAAATMIAKVNQKLAESYSLYKFAIKKQLLGNFADKAVTAGLYAAMNSPISPAAGQTKTGNGEAFIEQVKVDVETASFANENCLGETLIGGTPEDSLVLFVKKGMLPSLEVNVEAGAFNGSKLGLPAKVVVVDDFGTTANEILGMLVDIRGVKLHRGYHAIRAQENGFSDYVNMFDHSEHTGFISNYTFVKVYTDAASEIQEQ